MLTGAICERQRLRSNKGAPRRGRCRRKQPQLLDASRAVPSSDRLVDRPGTLCTHAHKGMSSLSLAERIIYAPPNADNPS